MESTVLHNKIMKIVVSLGNPGIEYAKTRHNAGRIVAELVAAKFEDKKVKFIVPATFMNKSGTAVAPFMKTKKDLSELIVIYDDIDLPLGKIKISFNRSHGGHNGLKSVIRALKSEEFLRIRIGIAPATAKGVAKKPQGEKAVLNFLLGEFKKPELETVKKLSKKVSEAIEMIYGESKEKAMSLFN